MGGRNAVKKQIDSDLISMPINHANSGTDTVNLRSSV